MPYPDNRSSAIFHRSTRTVPPSVVGGEGLYLIGADGTRYIDACGGAAVSCLGHGDADIRAAIIAQLDRVAYAHTGFFTTDAAEDLARHLVDRAPDGLAKVYLVSDGSEAIETALKMAYQYHCEREEPGRINIVSRWQSYHGNTLGALSAGGNRWRRRAYAPILLPNVHHIDPCYAYRHQAAGESAEEYGRRAADQLEAKLLELGPETVSCFIAETVVGATLGAVPPAPGYFQRIREICDRYGVLLILDEVMCGLGRCGTLHACTAEGINPDLLVLAKGLGAGYQPLGAVLCRQGVFDAFAEGSGAFQHGHTFVGHPVAAAAALAVQEALDRRGLVAQVARLAPVLTRLLRDAFADHPHVGDIRGRGFFQAIELVEDRADKRPFAPDRQVYAKIKQAAMARGLLVYTTGGMVDGQAGDQVLLAPPFIAGESDLAEIVGRLAEAVAAVVPR